MLLALASCGPQQAREPAIGQAFAGPTTLQLRQDLNTRSPVSATVHHGERLDVLEYKRRFVKVRTSGGIVGWTDTRQLLTPEQMSALHRMAENAAQLPSEGTATAFEALNIHTEPNRASPSFFQLPENAKVEVVSHTVAPRTQAEHASAIQPPKPVKKRRKKAKVSKALFPAPPAPTVPANWLELSKSPGSNGSFAEAALKPPPPPARVHLEDWSLVRTRDGQAGWVLSRMLSMGVPDDVAQYAEGHRITSYFNMGDVDDDGQVKHNWLWTTITRPAKSYEFDSFRFFIWSTRRHRYETAFIERGVVGHYPVVVNTKGPEPQFTLILEDDNGNWVKKTYGFNGYRVHLISAEPYQPKRESRPSAPVAVAQSQAGERNDSWYNSFKHQLTKLLRR